MTQPSSSIVAFTDGVFVNDSDRRFFNEKSIEISKTLFKEVLSETSKKNYNILLGASLTCVLLWLGVKIENISALAALKELSVPVIRYAAALSTIYFLFVFLISVIQDWQIYSYDISKNREELAAFMTIVANRVGELALKNLALVEETQKFFLSKFEKLDKTSEELEKLKAEMDLRMKEFEDNRKASEVLKNRYERLKKTFITHQNLSKIKYALEILFPVAVGIFAVTVSILNISPLK
jgi:hypothetical protein